MTDSVQHLILERRSHHAIEFVQAVHSATRVDGGDGGVDLLAMQLIFPPVFGQSDSAAIRACPSCKQSIMKSKQTNAKGHRRPCYSDEGLFCLSTKVTMAIRSGRNTTGFRSVLHGQVEGAECGWTTPPTPTQGQRDGTRFGLVGISKKRIFRVVTLAHDPVSSVVRKKNSPQEAALREEARTGTTKEFKQQLSLATRRHRFDTGTNPKGAQEHLVLECQSVASHLEAAVFFLSLCLLPHTRGLWTLVCGEEIRHPKIFEIPRPPRSVFSQHLLYVDPDGEFRTHLPTH